MTVGWKEQFELVFARILMTVGVLGFTRLAGHERLQTARD